MRRVDKGDGCRRRTGFRYNAALENQSMNRFKLIAPIAAAGALVSTDAFAAHWTSAVVLVPMDKGAYASAARITEYFQQAVSASPSYLLGETTQKIFGITVPSEAKEALASARSQFAEGKRLFAQGYLEEAEKKLRGAVKALELAVPAMDTCSEYCDSLAYLGATMQMKSDENQARELVKAVQILDPHYHFEGHGFAQNYTLIAKDVAKLLSHEAQFSTASIYSTPPGGKVFIDGSEKGFTPLSVDQIYAGKHYIRIERPGAYVWGQIINVAATEDAVVKAKLSSTPEHAAIDDMLDGVVGDVEKKSAGPDTIALCTKLKVDRAVIGTVRSSADSVTIEAGLIDAKGKKQLARRRATFEGDEFGQLEREVEKFANGLLADGDRSEKRSNSHDPLDHIQGTEDWSDEPVGEEHHHEKKTQDE
jgi:hypothetical protein